MRTSRIRRHDKLEKDDLKQNKLKWEKELKEKEEVISRLIKKVELFESLQDEHEENVEKLNILFQAGIIDIEGNIIKKDDK